MKMEYETEIVANMQHWVYLECLDAAPAISSPEFVSEKYKNFMLHICNMGLNRARPPISCSIVINLDYVTRAITVLVRLPRVGSRG